MKRAVLALAALAGAFALPAAAAAHPTQWRPKQVTVIDGPDRNHHADVVIVERGRALPPAYYGRAYRVRDYRAYHVAPPRRGYDWVQIGPRKLALVHLRSGRIVDVAHLRRW